jgi:hypothetical protein
MDDHCWKIKKIIAPFYKADQTNMPKAPITSLSKACTNKLYIFWQCMYIVYICDQVCQWHKGPSWLWSHGSCINIYLCNQCISKLSVRAPFMARCIDTPLCDQVWENHQLVKSHWQTSSHNVVSNTPRHQRDSNSQRL